MPIFGKNCLKSAKSSHAVPTEHTFTGLPVISGNKLYTSFFDCDFKLKQEIFYVLSVCTNCGVQLELTQKD